MHGIHLFVQSNYCEEMDLTPPSDGKIYIVCNRDNTTPNEHNHIILNK